MSGGFPLAHDLSAYFAQTAQNPGSQGDFPQTVTNNTKGAWAQLVASCGDDIIAIRLDSSDFWSGSSFGQTAFDLGIGGSGSEVALIPNMIGGVGANGYGSVLKYGNMASLQILQGTRIAVRAQNTNVAGNAFPTGVRLQIFEGSFTDMEGYAGVDAMGVSLAGSPYGTAVTSGTNSTYGSWTQIVASTSRDYAALWSVRVPTTTDTTNFPWSMYQIGVGGSGSEQPICEVEFVQQFKCVRTTLKDVQVPSGSRLSVRMGVNTAAYTGADCVALYGFWQ